ncbi:MAG: nuclear transport factor 2 family protein [Wenzhouxiangella sp.]|jgi:ketosteroid isomerase-like protein|nr:nuclear transport factor 2 family protein [Wenzhouxiangella sp.]
MMFRLCLILTLLLSLPAPPLALADEAETELAGLLDTFLQGASRNDASVHERFWAEQLIYTSSSGARFGKAEIMAGLAASAEGDPVGPSYSARDRHVQVFGDTAVVTFQLVADQAGQPTELFYNTGVFRVIDGRWQAVVWQATRADN